MNDPELESSLRAELRRHGLRWSKSYSKAPDELRRETLARMEQRRAIDEEREAAIRKKLDEEPIPLPDGPTCGTLQSGTGGGRRVIMKGSPFS